MKKIIIAMLSLTLLVGCQSDLSSDSTETVQKTETPDNVVVESLGQPYSRGPAALPEESVVGPTYAPPEKETPAGAQAVTTSEDIRLTLPRKTD